MTFFDVYVGELGTDGALDWRDVPRSGNTPKRIGPKFPSIDFSLWSRTCRIMQDSCDGVRLDMCAVAARVTVEQVRWLAAQLYGDAVPDEIGQLVAALDADRQYALIALED